MTKKFVGILCLLSSFAGLTIAVAQQRPPALRDHRATEAKKLMLQPATVVPIAPSKITVTLVGNRRVLKSNSISNHKTGKFPGRGNPNKITQQDINISLPAFPQKNGKPQFYQLATFGIGINGVIFEPQAAEWYRGRRGSIWQYDALGGALPLGFDEHVAHVQPNGTYHYHGLPKGLLGRLKLNHHDHSPIIGWAMDGFPIYALYGINDAGQVIKVKSGYRLKAGDRPTANQGPGGTYDGAFVADYEHIGGVGVLDECNGKQVLNEDFPNGTYAYFLTEAFPIIPRCFYGTPVAQAFKKPAQSFGRSDGGRNLRGDNHEARLQRAADALGVSATKLKKILGPPPPNFRAAAQKLGISEHHLRRLLGAR